MKPILINNITKRRIRLLDKFLENSKLFGCYVMINGEDFTDDVKRLLIRHGVTVIIPMYCTELTDLSVAEIEKRNPGFEKRVLDFPRHKIAFLRRSLSEPSAESITVLALSFPGITIFATRNPNSPIDGFYDEREKFNTVIFPELTPEECQGIRIDWESDFDTRFRHIDFELLIELGLIKGDDECLLLVKA
ncbi:hypothetical protein EVJ02_24165 [Salmonella enterica subsp. enterica serovar Kedougou]|nr:hypothetical protein [Salmonella enterica subsp. enterica serovar Kedougou]EGN9442051.1 hypothetical protein [Salmonella enterica]